MTDKTIGGLSYGGASLDPLSLIPVAPKTAGTSGTDPTLNSYGDAENIFVKDLAGAVPTYTVAGLPAAGTRSRRAWVSDAAASPVFGAAPTGGGTLFVPVYDDGTTWRYG